MKRLLAVVMAGSAVACSTGLPCSKDSECPGYAVCDPELKLCFLGTDGGNTGGGAQGGGAGGGGSGQLGGGGGGAVGGGSGGGGDVDAGRDAGVPYCDAGLGCGVLEECVASPAGGACTDARLELRWSSPDAGLLTNAVTVVGGLVVTKQDGGVVPTGLVPKVAAPAGASASVNGAASPFAVMLGLAPGDGAQTFEARLVDGGAVVPLVVNVDRSGPVFTIQPLADAGYGAATADFIPTDQALPTAFRKDEVVTVQVTTPATDVASVKLVARFGAGPRTEVTTSTPCTAAGQRCDAFQLDLSQVSMAAFNGPVRLTVEGADRLGNAGTEVVPRDVSVTRWQWARKVTTTQAIRSAPALGTGGRIFLATAIGGASPAGAVVALNSDGTVAWGPLAASGPIEGAVAVGRGATGEWLFYAVNSGDSVAASAATGVPANTCNPNGNAATVGGVALVREGTSDVGSISLQPGGSTNRGRQNEALSTNCRPSVAGLTGIQAPGNIVVGGGNAYYVDGDGNLRRLGVTPGADPTVGTLSQTVGGIGITNGLALLSGTRVAGGGPGIGKLFAFDVAGNTATSPWASPTPLSSPTSGPSVGMLGLFAQYRVSGASVLLRVNASDGVVAAQSASLSGGALNSSFSGTGAPTPVLGADSRVYVVDDRGSLFVVPQAFASNTNAQWGVALPPALTPASPVVTASPTLDCNRRKPTSETGVLYIATETGWLVSYLVDAKGLDTAAPWPKYARDARNTGNFQGPSIACP